MSMTISQILKLVDSHTKKNLLFWEHEHKWDHDFLVTGDNPKKIKKLFPNYIW